MTSRLAHNLIRRGPRPQFSWSSTSIFLHQPQAAATWSTTVDQSSWLWAFRMKPIVRRCWTTWTASWWPSFLGCFFEQNPLPLELDNTSYRLKWEETKKRSSRREEAEKDEEYGQTNKKNNKHINKLKTNNIYWHRSFLRYIDTSWYYTRVTKET